LRELFLYLLVHTTSSKGRAPGVTTAELTADLWPEHDAHGAKNIRGVSIKRLRDFLREVGGTGVVQTDSRWRVEMGDHVHSDFQELMNLLQDPHSGLIRGEQKAVERFLQIVSGGPLLAGEDYPWLEGIRADVSRSIIGMTVLLLRNGHRVAPAATVVSLAEVGLVHEPVNEELLSHKIKALVSLGRHGAARAAYDSFAAEYAEIAGRPFPRTFQECSS
jgi:two-component SAPR family response regulator